MPCSKRLSFLPCAGAATFPSTSRSALARHRCTVLQHAQISAYHRVQWTCREQSFWVHPLSKPALTTALERGISKFLFNSDQNFSSWTQLGNFDAAVIDADGKFEGGVLKKVNSPHDVQHVLTQAGQQQIVLMDATNADWKAIPAENVIAAYHDTPTKIFTVVQNASDAHAMLNMLERGVDGVVLRSADVQIVRQFCALKESFDMENDNAHEKESLTYAVVEKVIAIGTGERVCVDTCSMLAEHEGIFVGASSRAMFLVLSEAAKCEYVNSRAFRVNAGAVCLYVAATQGNTLYLSEMEAGAEVLVYGNEQGRWRCRKCVVGRAKIETRPLLMVSAFVEGCENDIVTVFLQNAETVRLAALGKEGVLGAMETISVCKLKKGHKLILKRDPHARHTGIAVEERIVEK